MSSAVISLMFATNHTDVVLIVSTSPNLSSLVFQSTATNTTNRALKVEVSNLSANTKYYYGVRIGGVLQEQGRGSFKTYPEGVSNFSCAFSSCAHTGSENEVFDTIRSYNPDFFIHMGDLHYEDITVNDQELYRNAFDAVFASSRQSTFFANVPTVYMWDDHDFCGENSRGSAESKPSAHAVYKERVPHYPLNSPNAAMYQSFVCGRVRFIVTDLRSEKSMTNSTMMGEEQLQWFFSELLKPEPLKVWVSTIPWIAPVSAGSDTWSGIPNERERIANFIKDNDLEGRVAIISGDMHALAIDDGRNSDYATNGGAKIPVFQASPLHQRESTKGGPYAFGPFLNGETGNQFGLMNIADDGEKINVEWQAKRGTSTLMSYSFSYPPQDPTETPGTEPIKALPTNGLVLSANVLESTITATDGKVSQISDLSGLGNHVSQTDVERQPTLVNNAHGSLPAIRLNGTSSTLRVQPLSNQNLSSELSIFLVVAFADPNGGSTKLIDFSGANWYSYKSIHKSGSQDVVYAESSSATDGISFSVADEPFKYLLITNINSANESSLYKNGELKGTANVVSPNLSAITTIDIGRTVDGLYYLNGDFADLVVYNRAIKDNELVQIQNYLMEKWNIS